MYNKNDIINVRIIDMGNDGEGIGKVDGFPFFIKGAVIGDTVEALVMKCKKSYGFARLMKVTDESPDRMKPACTVAGRCGGCSLQAMSYEAQLSYKEMKVRSALERIGGVDPDLLERISEPIIGMEDPFRYRNKSIYPVTTDSNGRIITGFYAGRTHSVIECRDCVIGPKENRQILDRVIFWMERHGIRPYDEKTGSGLVRHVFIRKAFSTGELQVCLVVTGEKGLHHISELISSLEEISSIMCISLNINSERTNVIMGSEFKLLSGKEWIEDELMGLRFRISPPAFFQVNPTQTRKLYDTALDFADLKGNEYVWDICCGIGTITLAAADRMRRVWSGSDGLADFVGNATCSDATSDFPGRVMGLEIVPQAIEDAKINAELNGFQTGGGRGCVDFVCAAAEDYLPDLVKRSCIQAPDPDDTFSGRVPDVVIADPPRAGLDRRVIDAFLEAKPGRIVYVSCDPATLARDINLLTAGGYTPKRIRPVDMFPHTSHVETVVLLTRQNT